MQRSWFSSCGTGLSAALLVARLTACGPTSHRPPVSAPVVTSTGPAETHEITPPIDVSGAPEPEVSARHASELASTGETASTDVTIAPEAAPTPIQSGPGALQAQGRSTALTSELDADTRERVVRVTRALERAGSSRRAARTDAADDLCQVLEAPAPACAPTEGAAVHARCHAVIQAAHSIEGLEDEVAEGRRTLRRLAASDRDAEYARSSVTRSTASRPPSAASTPSSQRWAEPWTRSLARARLPQLWPRRTAWSTRSWAERGALLVDPDRSALPNRCSTIAAAGDVDADATRTG